MIFKMINYELVIELNGSQMFIENYEVNLLIL